MSKLLCLLDQKESFSLLLEAEQQPENHRGKKVDMSKACNVCPLQGGVPFVDSTCVTVKLLTEIWHFKRITRSESNRALL